MRAITYSAYGNADVLEIVDAPVPDIGPDEVLIKSAAAAVNPIDWKLRAGLFQKMRPLQFPMIPGTDISGVIERKGALVHDFAVGDRIFARVEKSHAEYVVAKVDNVAHAPASLLLGHAAALPVAAGVAWLILFDVIQLRAGQRILIHAAAGGVGHIAVQLARAAGADVVATCSGANVDYVHSLGAAEVIDYRHGDFTSVSPVDAVFDLVGGDTQRRSFSVIRKGGILASVAAPPDQELASAAGVRATFGRRDINGAVLANIAQLIDAGIVCVEIGQTFSLEQIRQAHEISESGHGRGKIILTF